MKTIKEFIDVAEMQTLTAPQKKILHYYKIGWRLKSVNEHLRSGGNYIWVDMYGSEIHAGKVYRAFWNLVYKVEKSSGEFNKNILFA